MDGHRTGPPRGTGEQNPAYRTAHHQTHADQDFWAGAVNVGAALPMSGMVSEGYERRIVGRVDMAAIPVLWRVPPPDEKRGRLRRRRAPETGLLLDLSVSGLQVRAPATDELSRGAVVHVALDGVHGWGTIRRITPVPGTRFAHYGLELSTDATELTEWVHARVAGPSGVSESDWH